MKKKILSIVLLLAILFSLAAPLTAFAEETQANAPVLETIPTESVETTATSADLSAVDSVGAIQESPVETSETVYPAEEPLFSSEYSGKYGDSVAWSFNASTGVLSFFGSGPMEDSDEWDCFYEIPWFDYRSSIKKIKISGVTRIGSYAFYLCDKVTDVEISSGVKSIGECAFYGCKSLINMTLPAGVQEIESGAFSFSGVLSVNIPNSVTALAPDAFSGCMDLTSIDVDYSNKYYASQDGVLYDKGETRLLRYPINKGGVQFTVPTGVKSIEGGAFEGCKIRNIALPNGVSSIGEFAFYYCSSLESIAMPSSITKIEAYAFSGCDNLKDVNYYGTQAQWKRIVISNEPEKDSYISGNINLINANIHYIHTHAPISYSATVANCIKQGNIAYWYCPDCGKYFSDSACKNEIAYGSWVLDKTPHTPDGNTDCSKATKCTVCGTILKAAGQHTWNNGTQTKDPSCTAKGTKTYTCTVCNATKTEDIAALGHSFTNYVSDNNATCAKDGTKTAKCDRCTETKTVADTGSKNNVAHTSDGNTDCSKATKCTVCGKTLKAAGQHTWNSGTQTKAPTCTVKGTKTYTCTVCNATKTEDIAALGHSFTNYVSNNDATCAKDGTKTAKCDRCTETKTVTDTGSKNSVAHTPDGNKDCTKATKCTVCKIVLKPAGQHIWDDGDVTIKPSCTAKGEAIYTCTVDGAKETRELAPLGHDLQYIASGATITETCSRCDHTAAATVSATDAVYTGAAIKNATIEYGKDWLGGNLTADYENNQNAGMATAKITKSAQTASVNFAIEKATDYTITLGNLSQTVNSISPVTAAVSPTDSTATVKIEYEVKAENAEEDAEPQLIWTEEMPTAAGTYNVRAWLEASENIIVPETPSYTEGQLTITATHYGYGIGGAFMQFVDTVFKPNTTYYDVAKTAWYSDAVDYVTEKGLMTGTSAGEFSPEAPMTRAMLMTVLARYAGQNTISSTPWYAKAMYWAKENGVSDGSNPLGNVTREQLVTMLYRFAGSPEANGELNFADADEISAYAIPAMRWAVTNGIITGVDAMHIAPQANATRAQVAAILMRYIR